MTREEAIYRIKDHMVHHGIGRFPHILLAEAMKMAISALREQEERSKGCHNCYGNDMAIDAVDNPCWNCKGDHSEWKPMTREEIDKLADKLSEQRDAEGLTPIEKLAARYEKATGRPWKKPMTNADHIRSLSDEELAKFLYWYCPYDEAKMDCEESDCDECVADWLKLPYEEDA